LIVPERFMASTWDSFAIGFRNSQVNSDTKLTFRDYFLSRASSHRLEISKFENVKKISSSELRLSFLSSCCNGTRKPFSRFST
jgi:hypothetical protein